jgi:TonB family protein
MRLAWGRSILTAVALMAFVLAAASAQQANEEAKRKLKSRINPVLSDVARRMGLSGKVRIEVTIAPDGRVKSARALGGHPLLVQACLEAVKEGDMTPRLRKARKLSNSNSSSPSETTIRWLAKR